MEQDEDLSLFNEEQRTAYLAYKAKPEHNEWDTLSQVEIKQLLVMDAVKDFDPSFPDPYPLPVAGIAGDDFLYWQVLPKAETVYAAMVALLKPRNI